MENVLINSAVPYIGKFIGSKSGYCLTDNVQD